MKAQPTLSKINQASANAAKISRYCFIGDIIIINTSAVKILPGIIGDYNTAAAGLINNRAILYNVENIAGMNLESL